MAPPTDERYSVQIDKGKTKTVKFKNGIPPKVIRSREIFEDFSFANSSNEPMQMVHQSDNSVSSSGRKTFLQSTVKHDLPKTERQKRSPFSPPPTMTELRSLTKKIGRFYTVPDYSTSPSHSASKRSYGQHGAILDIEKALSRKDMNGLEKCYRRIFNGDMVPIRTLVKNQLLPNQRSRQLYPPEMKRGNEDSEKLSLSSNGVSKTSKSAPTRRWSIDSVEDKRLPIVPVPYFRNETRSSPSKTNRRYRGEGPVMYSSPRNNYTKHSKSISTTAVLTLDPSQFPQVTRKRSQQTESASVKMTANNANGINKKSLLNKSSSTWNQRAPNTTPEPTARMLSDPKDRTHGETNRDLVPHIATAQFFQPNHQVSRQADTKRAGIKNDTSVTHNRAQTSNDHVDIGEKVADLVTQADGIVTSVDIKSSDDLCSDESVDDRAEKNRSKKDDVHEQSYDLSTAIKIPVSNQVTNSEDEEIPENSEDLDSTSSLDNTRVQDIQPKDSSEKEGRTVASDEDNKSQVCSEENPMIETNTERRSKELESEMDKVTVVVVNVTTDEGENINADIYEYPRNENNEKGKQTSGEADDDADNLEAAKSAFKSRKDELDSLLKEHSNIVEQIKTLSKDGE